MKDTNGWGSQRTEVGEELILHKCDGYINSGYEIDID